MRNIFKSILVIMAIAAVGTTSTLAIISDNETETGNTFTSGILDLTVNGEDEPLSFSFSGNNLLPGVEYNAGTVELKNVGTVDGNLTLKIINPVSNENGVTEPESDAGDSDGVEVDLTGYDANEGDGELWDQSKMKIYLDLNNDGVMQWNEPVVYSGPMGLDMTGYYSIPLNTDLFPSAGLLRTDTTDILSPDETIHVGLLVEWMDDAGSPFTSQPQYNGMSNNQAMGDDMQFDIVFGLEQITP
jgi:predicted ribosomally synthesized peptide with SipW-like signal peptide